METKDRRDQSPGLIFVPAFFRALELPSGFAERSLGDVCGDARTRSRGRPATDAVHGLDSRRIGRCLLSWPQIHRGSQADRSVTRPQHRCNRAICGTRSQLMSASPGSCSTQRRGRSVAFNVRRRARHHQVRPTGAIQLAQTQISPVPCASPATACGLASQGSLAHRRRRRDGQSASRTRR